MRVAFLGLGLIGGSIAIAARSPSRTFIAWTPSGDGPARALRAGAIDEVAATPGEAVRDAELILLAAPPLACIGLIRWLGDDGRAELDAGATVTDVASTKGAVTRAAARAAIPFVGGHPMAGRETTGFASASPDLLKDRPWIITDAVGGGEPERVEALAVAAGARPVHMTADAHDKAVAGISLLPLVLSTALVEAVLGAGEAPDPDDLATLRALAAGGWRDMTRVASGDPAMGAGIAATNAHALAKRLRAYRDRLDEWLALLEADGDPDARALELRFADARRRLGSDDR